MLKLTTDKHEASRGLSATAELLVLSFYYGRQIQLLLYGTIRCCVFNPVESRGNYSAISNNMKLVHWPLMGGLLHLVQRGWFWSRSLFFVKY